MDLYEYFSQFHAISKQDFEFLKTSLRERTFQKGEFITLPGQVQKNLYIVKQGVQMSFYETEKHKHVIDFLRGILTNWKCVGNGFCGVMVFKPF